MNLREYVDKTVLLNITEPFSRDNAVLLGGAPNARLFYAKLKDADEHGLWVENPSWSVQHIRSGECSSHKIVFLVPWFALVSVAAFPERKFANDDAVPDRNIRTIGFTSQQ